MSQKNQLYQNESLKNHTLQEGTITRVLPDGYGYIESGEQEVKRSYIFSFGTIQEYKGETAKELNLHQGSKVLFDAEGDKVTTLILEN